LTIQSKQGGTCSAGRRIAQGYWTFFHNNVRAATGAQVDLMRAYGLAIGFEDTKAPINRVHSARASIDEFVTFID